MIHTSKKLKNSDLELTVTLDQKDLDHYIHKTVEQLKGEIQINGYRKGKVPTDVLKKNIGEDKIKENALNIAVQESLAKLIEKEDFDVLDYSNLKVKENSPNKLVYTVELTTFPEIKIGKYTDVKVTSRDIGVTDEEIDKTLADIRETRTEYRESQEAAKLGDRVEVDFEVMDNGKIIDGGKSENHPLVLGKKTFVPGFEEAIVGMKLGEEKNFSLRMPVDYHEKSIAGKEMDFKVKLKKVYDAVPPVLDDVFAKSLGNFTSLDQLKENVRSGLFEEKKNKESERIKLAILDEILKDTHVEVPKKLVESKLDAMVSNFDQELHGRGLELGLYLAHLKQTQESFREGFRSQAEKQVKIDMILREVGRKENIKISESEIEAQLTEINAAINLQDEITKNGLDVETLRNRIRQSLFTEKVFHFLAQSAEITPA